MCAIWWGRELGFWGMGVLDGKVSSFAHFLFLGFLRSPDFSSAVCLAGVRTTWIPGRNTTRTPYENILSSAPPDFRDYS